MVIYVHNIIFYNKCLRFIKYLVHMICCLTPLISKRSNSFKLFVLRFFLVDDDYIDSLLSIIKPTVYLFISKFVVNDMFTHRMMVPILPASRLRTRSMVKQGYFMTQYNFLWPPASSAFTLIIMKKILVCRSGLPYLYKNISFTTVLWNVMSLSSVNICTLLLCQEDAQLLIWRLLHRMFLINHQIRLWCMSAYQSLLFLSFHNLITCSGNFVSFYVLWLLKIHFHVFPLIFQCMYQLYFCQHTRF